MSISELERKLPPKDEDIEETRQLFMDFGIPVYDIPDFKTYHELERWRRDRIVKRTRR